MTKFNETLKKMWVLIKKGLIWADNHKKMTLLFLVVLITLIYGITYIFSTKLKHEKYDLPGSQMAIKTGEISNDSGEVLVIANDTKSMYINTKTTNISIVDNATNTRWDSLGLGGIILDSNGNATRATSSFASPFIMNFIRKDGSQGSLDAYTNSIKDQDYTINTIENGIQIIYQVKDKTINIFEHLPRKIKISRYENFIKQRMLEAKDKGEITEAEVELFEMLWNAFYSKNVNEEAYNNQQTTLPTSSLNLVLKVLRIIGYNREELIKDNDQFGQKSEFSIKTTYTVVIETTLDGDDMIVKVPSAYAQSNNDFDQISSLSVFPYFSDMNSKVLPSENPGFIFVPDGSGALIELNDYDAEYPTYSKSVYNNSQYNEYYLLQDNQQQIQMPVFGMYGKVNDQYKGFLAIIEKGSETAKINAQPGDVKNGAGMNQINAQFDFVQSSYVKLFGFYAEDATTYLSYSKKYDFDAVIRYKLLLEDHIDYFSLAKIYQNYLVEQNDLNLNYNNFESKVFIDLIGNVTTLKHFLGIPYISDLSMTTYQEALTILEQLEDVNKVVNYRGAINDGLNQKILSDINFVKTNGSIEDFNKLKNYLEQKNDSLYVDLKFTNVYNDTLNKNYSLYGLDSKPLRLNRFDLASRMFDFSTTPRNILSPSYLSSLVDTFMSKNKYFDKITVDDLGNTYLVDFNKQNKVSPMEADAIARTNLDKLSQYDLILKDPYMDYIKYASYIENVGRESTNHNMFKTSIPFKQLVMNGIVEYSTLDVNINTSKDSDYYLLQALELGSHPKFTLSYKDSSLLKDTEFNYFYATNYANWIDLIKEMSSDYKDAFEMIGTNEIINHEKVAYNVFKTTYRSGVSVIVNYNNYEVTIGDQNIKALGYKLEGGTKS